MNTYHIFFSKLANPLKISILDSLKEKDKSVNELVKDLCIEQSKLSHALKSLKCCKIVDVEKKGKKRVYSLNKKTILPMLKLIDEHEKCYCKQCEFRK